MTAVGTNARTEKGSAYLVQDTFGCNDVRAVTQLGAVDLTADDTLLALSQDATFTALDELRSRMVAG